MARVKKTTRRREAAPLEAQAPVACEQPTETKKRTALSGWPIILPCLAMLIFAIHASTHMVAAGDTWVAMACGRHFVHHGVDTVEPFSANSHKPGPTPEEVETWPKWARSITNTVGLDTVKKWHPTGWINQNWLAHVIFYWLSTTLGSEENPYFNALVYWKFATYILTIICVYYTGRLLGAHAFLSALFACFALFVGRSFLDVRPAGFSNLLVAVFFLVLVLTAYRNILYIWLLVPVTVFWCNVHGGYIYAFIMLVPFVGLHLLTNLTKKWTAILYNVTAWPFYAIVVSKAGLTMFTFLFFVLLIVLDFALIFYKRNLISIGWKGLGHTVAAGAVAFVAMVLFNPFHLTNLTHTFVISVSEHAARWRDIHEWHAAFDWENPVGTAVPFLVMYIIAWVLLGLWVIIVTLMRRSVSQDRGRKRAGSAAYQWPKLDFTVMIIAALTIYMAIRSRRFIPIAAVTACPVLAIFIDHIVQAISASRNFHGRNRLFVSPMPKNLQLFFTIAAAGAVVFFGTWWGSKFKHIYLDPWPNDPNLTSIFMRMTASDAKPFEAGQFIKMNQLKGKMFNYWTEGGFIAWAQEPDPNTGRTPLQLFMDGRAQAAYNRAAFDLWSYIMSGGLRGSEGYEVVQTAALKANMTGRELKDLLTSADYVKTGRSVDEALKRYDVWVALMPAGEFDSVFVRSLEYNPNWVLVFLNNKMKMFVDYTTPQGKELFDGIDTGQTRYPDDFSRSLTLAHNYLLYGKDSWQRKRGLDLAIHAFSLNESPTPMLELIVSAARFAELVPLVTRFCKDYQDRFAKNRDVYIRQNGYRLRLEAARLACMHLQKVTQQQRNVKLAQLYGDMMRAYERERFRLSQEKRW